MVNVTVKVRCRSDGFVDNSGLYENLRRFLNEKMIKIRNEVEKIELKKNWEWECRDDASFPVQMAED